MGKRQKGNPHLKQAMLEVVDNQLRDNPDRDLPHHESTGDV
ncbi:MAG: hypothetical protein ABSC55_26480 [Syntrophorhabdales bacterium]